MYSFSKDKTLNPSQATNTEIMYIAQIDRTENSNIK